MLRFNGNFLRFQLAAELEQDAAYREEKEASAHRVQVVHHHLLEWNALSDCKDNLFAFSELHRKMYPIMRQQRAPMFSENIPVPGLNGSAFETITFDFLDQLIRVVGVILYVVEDQEFRLYLVCEFGKFLC